MPGVQSGDLGPKLGYHEKDNGWMTLKNVRIPRTNILKRYLEVTKEGEVETKGNPLVLYSIMMFTRLQVATTAQILLSRGLTIATRYAIVRS